MAKNVYIEKKNNKIKIEIQGKEDDYVYLQ